MGFWVIATIALIWGTIRYVRRHLARRRYQDFIDNTAVGLGLIYEAKTDLPLAIARVEFVQENYPESVFHSYKSFVYQHSPEIYDAFSVLPQERQEDSPWLTRWPESLVQISPELDRLHAQGNQFMNVSPGLFAREDPREIWNQWHIWMRAIGHARIAIEPATDMPDTIRQERDRALAGWYEKVLPLTQRIEDLLYEKEYHVVQTFIDRCREKLNSCKREHAWLDDPRPEGPTDWIDVSFRIWCDQIELERLGSMIGNCKKITEEDMSHLQRLGIV